MEAGFPSEAAAAANCGHDACVLLIRSAPGRWIGHCLVRSGLAMTTAPQSGQAAMTVRAMFVLAMESAAKTGCLHHLLHPRLVVRPEPLQRPRQLSLW